MKYIPAAVYVYLVIGLLYCAARVEKAARVSSVQSAAYVVLWPLYLAGVLR